MKILITAGGTGGHLFPGIALAQEFKRQVRGAEILFVGTSHGLESRVLQREKYLFRAIRVEGLIGRSLLKSLRAILLLPISLVDAYRVLKGFGADLAIGIGGYASGPVLLLAGFFGVKRVLLEPNAHPGWTNRALVRLGQADLVIVAFEESRPFFTRKLDRTVTLGNPVRRDLIFHEAGDHSQFPTLLVLGGSQGAHSINLAMIESLEHLIRERPDLSIMHQTGERDFEMVRRAYEEKGIKARVEAFLFDMGQAYRMADLVLCRAGATTLAEITACGKPAILIPYPHATHQHQLRNAQALAQAGSAVVIEDHNLSGPVLSGKVLELIGNREKLRAMAERSRSLGKPQAAEEIVKRCIDLIKSA